jgi:hypothetical protein
MAKVLEKRKVIELRLQGKSYSEIKKIVNVSKSSLSLWLKNVPLTEEQILGLKKKKERAVERYRETMKLKRMRRSSCYYVNQINKWIPLSDREIFIAGLFLYLGEGNKVSRNSVGITNTDPSVIKFALYWIINSLKVPKEKVRVQLHLYNDMNFEKESNFWLRELQMEKSCLTKPYIKKSFKTSLDQKGFGHGTCGLFVHKTIIKENILLAIRAITDNYSINPIKFDIID